MRRVARGVFATSAGLALAAGGVLAFGQAQLVSGQSATAGNGSFAIANQGAPVDPNTGQPGLLYDNNTATPVLAGTVQNTSNGQGQSEIVSATVQNIQDSGYANAVANNGTPTVDQDLCQSFVGSTVNGLPTVSGKVGWATDPNSVANGNTTPTAANASSPNLVPTSVTSSGGDSANWAVFLKMMNGGTPPAPTAANPTTKSTCADETLSYDVVFTSVLGQ